MPADCVFYVLAVTCRVPNFHRRTMLPPAVLIMMHWRNHNGIVRFDAFFLQFLPPITKTPGRIFGSRKARSVWLGLQTEDSGFWITLSIFNNWWPGLWLGPDVKTRNLKGKPNSNVKKVCDWAVNVFFRTVQLSSYNSKRLFFAQDLAKFQQKSKHVFYLRKKHAQFRNPT